ncbi:MAG: hypothetical protein NVS9B10_30980 [Nevskia sp.]
MHKTKLLLIGMTFGVCAVQAAETVAPDNTKVNERDRSSQTLKPEDQSESKQDLSLAASVRRSIVRHKGLSISGQNVKIVAQDNKVTLRGPVKNAAEKNTIEKLARQAAGKATVESQLEVEKN